MKNPLLLLALLLLSPLFTVAQVSPIGDVSIGPEPHFTSRIHYYLGSRQPQVRALGVYNFQDKQSGLTGLFDSLGNVVAPPVYDNIANFLDPIARTIRNGKCGLLACTGKELLPCLYDEVIVSEGVALVKKDGRFSYYNSEGKKISTRSYDGGDAFYKGYARVYVKGRGYGLIDQTGAETCRPEFDAIYQFPINDKTGIIRYEAWLRGKEIVIDTNGNEIVN
jgi:hypothetical protein